MSSISARCRSSSRPRSVATSGSTSASPAARSCSRERAVATIRGIVLIGPRELTRAGTDTQSCLARLTNEGVDGRHGALSEHPRLRACEVEHRRRHARAARPRPQARRTRRGSPRAPRRAFVGSGPPWRFALVAMTAPTAPTTSAAASGKPARARRSSPPRARSSGGRDSRRRACTARAAAPGRSPRAAPARARAACPTSATEKRRRLPFRPSLQRESTAARRLRLRVCAEPVNGVRGQHDGLPARSAATASTGPPRPGRAPQGPASATHVGEAELLRAGRRPLARCPRPPRARARRWSEHVGAARAICSVTPCPTSACGWLPVTHFGLKHVEVIGLDVRRIRYDEVVRSARQPVRDVVDARTTRDPRVPSAPHSRAASASASSDTSIAVTVASDARPRSRARSLPCPSRRRARTGASPPSSSARQRSTTTSVSGRGISARESTFSVSLPEPPLAEDVRERLARAASPHELAAGGGLLGRQRPVVLEVEVEPRDAERMGDEMLCVDARARHVLACEEIGRSLDGLGDRHGSRRT